MADKFCMLAPAEWPHHYDMPYPFFVQLKADGVRAFLIDKVFYSRNMKPIRNKMVQKIAKQTPNYLTNYVLDGEWWAPGVDFNTIQSIIMDSDDALPSNFCHLSWDAMGANQWHKKSCDRQYVERLELLSGLHRRLNNDYTAAIWLSRFRKIDTHYVGNPFVFANLYSDYLAEGHEGVMVKSPNGLYKWGRTTVREATMYKYKPVFDIDIRVAAVEEGKGKRKGMCGFLVAKVGQRVVKFGPGKEVDDKHLKWMLKNASLLKGQKHDCYHSGMTPDGSLRFPKFRPVRLGR